MCHLCSTESLNTYEFAKKKMNFSFRDILFKHRSSMQLSLHACLYPILLVYSCVGMHINRSMFIHMCSK